jgi:4-amino-4-deoxy-L-arabinose transferase-like glycosyltransferase
MRKQRQTAPGLAPDKPASGSPRAWLLLALLLLIIYTALFQDLRGIWETSEGRYVNVAMEMLRFSDWVHPITHHEHPHWTKPPFTYWSIATALDVAGHSEFAVRLPGMLAFALTTLMVFLLGRLFHPQRPWLPALIYASCLAPATASNIITTDNLLTFAVTAAFTGFAYAYWGRPGSFAARYGALFGWLAAGIGFLVKGPAVGLPLFALLLFHLFNRRAFPLARMHWRVGIPLSALVGGSWFFMLAGENPQLIVDFIYNEVVLRATTGKHHRNSEWYGGFVIYGPVLLVGTLPWTWHIWRGLKQPLVDGVRSVRGQPVEVDERDKLLLLWVLVPLAVFMVAKSRLPLYVLPLFAPLALLAARRAEGLLATRRWYLLPLIGVVAVLGVRVTAGLVENHRDSRMLAAHLQQVWPQHVDEVVFVGDESQQGLAFYMDTEVEQTTLLHLASESTPSETVIEELLNKDQEGKRLWLVREGEVDRFAAAVHQTGYRLQALGDVEALHDYRIYRAISP